jgi:adenylate kinase
MIEPMAKRNYLVEGVSGTGKSSVCNELRKLVIKPLMATGNLPIRATLKRENEQTVMVMSTMYGTLVKSEK